jgi:Lrp/AsnC family transcriptional regulator for asnA, asnC and gidA
LSEANKYPDVIESFKRISEIVECHFVTGKFAILIKLYCFDHDHLMEILLNTIQKIPYVLSTDTQISLDQAIERQVWVKEYQNTSFSASVKKSKMKSAKESKENKD